MKVRVALWLSLVTPALWMIATPPGSQAQQAAEYRLIVVSLVDTSVRTLDISTALHMVAFSPRGDRIVAQTSIGDGQGFLSVAPDGSNRREYRTSASPIRTRPLDIYSISPNGERIAFRTLADTLEKLLVLNLVSGQEQVLATAGRVQQYRWRSDDELDYTRVVNPRVPSPRSVNRVTVQGQDRLLRVLSDSFRPGSGGIVLINDTLVAHHPRGARVDLINLRDGNSRRVYEGSGAWMPAVSRDSRFLAYKTAVRIPVRYNAPNEGGVAEADAIAIIDLQTGQRRDLQLDLVTPGMAPPVWHPDGQSLVVAMRRRDSSEQDLYLVPINGAPARLIVRAVGTSLFMVSAVSPDGKQVVLSVPNRAR